MQKKRVSSILSCLVLGIAFFLCSCGDYVGKEKTHPLFVKAGTAKSAGNFQEAAKCYEEFLLICPRSTVTNKELADLYNDTLNEPLKAVFYYERWLQMLPPDAAQSSEIRSFAENARKNLFKKLSELYKDDPSLQTASGEMKKVQTQLAAYIEHSRRLTERNKQLVSIIEQLNEERRKINAARRSGQYTATPAVRRTEKKQTQVRSQTAPRSAAPSKVQPSAAKGTVYTVQKGDTLFKISRKFYGTSAKVSLIRNANSGKIGRNNAIRLGQKLVIPAVQGSGR